MIEFRILGPLEVVADDRPVALGGPKVRALLAVLLLHRGEVVSTDRLIDALWGERASTTAAKTVQVYVSNLRKALGDGLLITRAPGYVLRTVPEQVDADQFAELVAAGRDARRSGDPQVAARTLREALALWRSSPLADFEYESFAQNEIARLEEARLAALEDRIDADLAAGEHVTLVSELEQLVREHPLRERLEAELMLALYRSGRQADALESYRRARRSMREELGLEPGRSLQELEQAILVHDRALDGESRRPGPRRPAPTARRRRGAWLLAAGAALLAAVIALVAVRVVGSGPTSVQVAPNSVAAIDPNSNTVAAAVPVGSSPGAITFGAGSLWVANLDDQTVSRIDPRSLRTLRTFPLEGPPTGLAATEGAIWAVQSTPQNPRVLTPIAAASSVLVNAINPQYDTIGPTERLGNIIPGGSGAAAAQGSELWVAPSSGLLVRLDPATGGVLQPVDPNSGPSAIAVGAGAVWVADSNANNVTRVDPTGLLTPIPVGNGPGAIAVGAGGVWVTDASDDAVVRIDPDTNSATTMIPVGRSPADVAVGAGSVWVANSGDGTVTRIDPGTRKVVATITVGGSPQAVAIADGRAWVTIDAPTVRSATPAQGGVLRIDSADVDSMDPALAYTDQSLQLLQATCAKLLNYRDRAGQAGSQLTAEVATSLPALSADGKTYTFTIRDGFRFSPPSNQPVTAQTFKDTIERSLSPEMKSPLDYQFADIAGARAYMAGKAPHIAGVTARGDRLMIRLLAPAPDLLTRVAQSVFCAVPGGTPIDPKGLRTIPMAGPYYIASYAPGQGVVLKRNPNYRGSRPHALAEIDVAVNVSPDQAAAQIEAGRADYAPVVSGFKAPSLAARYGPGSPAAARGIQQYFINPRDVLWFLALNTHRPLFSSVRLRQAVNYAVDRAALARTGGFQGPPLQPTDQYLPPAMPGYQDVRIYPFTPDIVRARQLMRGRRGVAALYTCNEPSCEQQAQIVKTDLAALGITVQVNAFPFPTLNYKINHGAPWDIANVAWEPDYPDPRDFLNYLLTGGSVIPAFDDPTYDRRLAQAAQLSGPARYLTYAALASDLNRNAAPWIAYGNPSSHEFFSTRVGCQTYGVYDMDLAALCIRSTHR